MNLQKILFPTDFSDSNDEAFQYAQRLAAESGAVLYIAHVDELNDLTSTTAETNFLYALPLGGNDRREIRERLRNIRPSTDGVVFKHRYLRGSPAEEILRFAQQEEIDLIVMGSHGRSGLSRLVTGSVAEGVMRKAQCPVLIVKKSLGTLEPESSTVSAVAEG